MKFNTIQQVTEYLASMPRFQSSGEKAARFDLERFRSYCKAAGNPQDRFPSIHVAGTNGKGSTCQILASVYQEAGYRVGLYTSPHLLDFRERFHIDGIQIGEEELLLFFQRHANLIQDYELTYFELSTAIAFWWFQYREVELAIVETGLGGRLDATNVLVPELSVITTVARDHTGILGSNIREIAREKAGIIKLQTPVVVGKMPPEARQEIESEAKKNQSPCFDIDSLKPEWKNGDCRLVIEGKQMRLPTDLIHPVQAVNMALAWRAVSLLQARFPVTRRKMKKGFRNVRKNYRNSGRFEKLHPELEWYFDGAHNAEAARAMIVMVSQLKPVDEAILVLSVMGDKLNPEMAELFQKFKKIYYYTLELERAAGYEEVKQWLPGVLALPHEAAPLTGFFKEVETELVIFAGSFYFYSTVREWLQSSITVHKQLSYLF